ncbi:hypothetical protein VTJ83DRAFT_4882 [Remersonia thermophila]|uniref:Uncharacterized protein n=1 Tax=Remersonia thermophila TaxID=72144 RepID=A0ABR4DB85_9PEZI
MPPPHLHPRSRMTSSLFATTLFASFFVVALPHVLPCPAPRRAFADSGAQEGAADAAPRRAKTGSRRRREGGACGREEDGIGPGGVGGSVGKADGDGREVVEFRPGPGENEDGEAGRRLRRAKARRECPVPKPGGILGEWLGFHSSDGAGGEGQERTRPAR